MNGAGSFAEKPRQGGRPRPFDRLREIVPEPPPDLAAAWQAAAGVVQEEEDRKGRGLRKVLSEAFYVLITCRDEAQQVELLGRFQAEGLACKAVLG